MFVLWLLSPATNGSSILYRKFVHPQLSKREKVSFIFNLWSNLCLDTAGLATGLVKRSSPLIPKVLCWKAWPDWIETGKMGLQIKSRRQQIMAFRIFAWCHYAGTSSLGSQQPTTGIPTCHPTCHPTCPKCGGGQHTLEHWLIECPALATTRLHLFGSTDVSLNQLSLEPAKSVTLAKKSLWGFFGVYASEQQQQQHQHTSTSSASETTVPLL